MIAAAVGHRPKRLPGEYDAAHPDRLELRARLARVLEQLRPARVRTGLALGFDQDAAEVCIRLGVPFDGVCPCDGFDARWTIEARQYLAWLCSSPLATITVAFPGPFARWKLLGRNQVVIEPADVVIAGWDGYDGGGTSEAIRTATALRKPIWRIDPWARGDLGAWVGTWPGEPGT